MGVRIVHIASTKKDKRLNVRISNTLFNKLTAICNATGKTKTAVIEDLILSEYNKDKKYEKWFLANF